MRKTGDVTGKFNRWFVALCGMLIMICLGVAYAWGIFLLPISDEFGWTRGSVSLAVALLLLTFSIFMPMGGALERRFGPKATSSVGGLLVSCGWILASFTQSLQWLYLTYGVLAGIGTGLSYLPAVSTGIKWFPDKKGLITGIIVFGFGFGSAFLAPIGTKLITNYGWRTTMLTYGIGFGTIIIMASNFLRTPPAGWISSFRKRVSEKKAGRDITTKEMLKTRAFKILFLTYFLSMVPGMMAKGHIIPFLDDAGYNAMQSAFSITILAIFNGIGRITCGALSDRIGAGKTLFALFFLIGAATISLNYMPGLFFLYIAAGLIGFCFGGFLSVYPSITFDYFGTEHFGVNYGIIFIGYGVGCFAGPWLGGLLHDITGRYAFAFSAAGTAAIAGSIITLLYLKKPVVPR